MKRFFTIILAVLLSAVSFDASAVRAYPYPIKVTQPDGSVITVQLHGDESNHWITADGQLVEMSADGFYRKVVGNPSGSHATDFSLKKYAPQKASSNMTTGEKHFLVILVNFSDLSFTNSQEAFYNLLNQASYSANKGTGSVRDYFTDNSNGDFTPVFDVVGPVTVSQKYSYYGANRNGDDAHAALAFWEACKEADAQVNFANYDLDSDGIVDNVFFYYAGHNEAEGGGSNLIWPHSSDMAAQKRYYDTQIGSIEFDGKTLGRYACTSELKGSSGKTMCGIGTFCHEFSHVLGLPDFYDTDYETNGEAYGMGWFSLMCSGNYNNDGRTPPALTAVERNMLGWMKEITEWTEPGVKTVPDIMDNEAFMTGTRNSGEYFVYETRGGSVWDSYINGTGVHGLLIYHVDRSSNRISGQTAASLWSSGKINAYGSHPCCQIEPSSGSFVESPDKITYPGYTNVTAFNANSPSPMIDWSGNQTDRQITDIKYSDGVVTLTYGIASGKTVSGTVKDKEGNPIVGATVVLTPVTSSKVVSHKEFNGLSVRSVEFNKAPSSGSYSATITSDGTFSFDLSSDSAVDFTMTASCRGYFDYVSPIRIVVGELEKNIVLTKIEALDEEMEFEKFNWGITSAYSFGLPVVASAKYTPDDLAGAAGSKMTYIGYYLNVEEFNEARVVVDFGDETVLDIPVTEFVPGEYSYEDISAYNLTIPADKDVYVGVYVDCDSTEYPYAYNSNMAGKNGFFVRLPKDHNWVDYSADGSLAVSFVVEPTHDIAYMYGFNGIDNPGEGHYAAGTTFKLKLVESAMTPDSVEWFFDGKSVEGTSVNLTSGEHTVKAVLHFTSGQVETIEQILVAE